MFLRHTGSLTLNTVSLVWPTHRTARWCNGSTADSGSVCHGSNPCRAASSFALSHDLIRLRVRDCLEKLLIAHHHGTGAATGETFHELNGELAVLRGLQPVLVRGQAKFFANVLVQPGGS